MEPDFLVCIDCETPCYTFEWVGGKMREAICTVCGNDDVDQFATPEDFEALMDEG